MKKLVIIGAGESGIGAAILAKKEGFDVFVSDFGNISIDQKNDDQHLFVFFENQINGIGS